MITTDVIKLIKSLSGPEKRHFKMFCKKQSGSKAYMDLYNLIDTQPVDNDLKTLEKEFQKRHPKKSFENTAQYLLKLITDSLIISKSSKNKRVKLYFCFMRSQVLLERSISKEGFKELRRAQQLAADLQDDLAEFNAYRQQLNYLSGLGFPKMTEKELVEMQMKAKANLRQLHQIQEHSFLFEQLRYRLTYPEKPITKLNETELNDFLLRELSLITRGKAIHFETEKNHLLFQGFFLINTGNFSSSLKTFKKLNELFEKNEAMWNFPPYHYLQTLEGILDNLRTIKYYQEMAYFIEKVVSLLDYKYPEHFQTTAKQVIYIYKLNILINSKESSNAIALSKSIPDTLLKNENLVNYEKQAELLLHISLAFFDLDDFSNANKQMKIIRLLSKAKENSNVYRASCLMHIIIHYELNNLSFLEYEMRAYKRKFRKKGELLDLEKIIFKVIKYNPRNKSKLKNSSIWKRTELDLQKIGHKSYQRQITKYYDFKSWIEKKLKVD